MKTIGEKIYELRHKQGISQEQLGFEINVSRQTISKWEANTMQPTTDNIQALCDYFKVEPNHFLNSDIEKTDEGQTLATTTETIIEAKALPSKRMVVLYAFLITFSAMLLTLCVIIGYTAISINNAPSLGYSEVQVMHVDWVSIVCFIVAGCALVSLITFIILLIKQKKRKM